MRQYMLSELIKDAVDTLLKEGDVPIMVDILTENQSNLFDVCLGLDVYNKVCHVTVDLDEISVSEFKKKIK